MVFALLLPAGAALAQATPGTVLSPVPADSAAATPAQAAQSPTRPSGELEEVVVTGSRVQKDGFTQPTPVTVKTTEALLATAPLTLSDGLNQLPQFEGSNQRSYCCVIASTGNYLNLRGIGSTRTLILLDGKRVVATRETGDVDVNLLPELLVQRVDIVTGGASAVYGSDAVSGVVNYVVDNRFVGVKTNFQGGVSNYGDDQSAKMAVAIGTSFAEDRGHIVASVEAFKANGIASLADRPTSNQGAFLGGNGTASAPYVTLSGVRMNTATYGGVIVGSSNLPVKDAANPLAGLRFNNDGSTTPFQFGAPVAGSAAFTTGGDGFVNNLAQPLEPLQTEHVYLRGSYDITDNIDVFARANIAESKNHGAVLADNRSTTASFTIFRDNAYLPTALAQQMDAAGVSSFRFAKFNRDLGPITIDYATRTYDIIFGAEGKFFDTWSWNLSYDHGASREKSRTRNDSILGNEYAAADAVRDPASGQIVCRVTLTNPGVFPGCQPANFFGEGNVSQAAKNYFLATNVQTVRNEQDIASGDVHGDVIDLWAGPVSVALGAEHRTRSLLEGSNAIALNQIQATGVRGFPTAFCPTPTTCRFGGFNQGNNGVANADDEVNEGFLEAELPLLKDLPFAHSLALNLAGRFTDYSTSGDVQTYKVGITYQPIEDLRIRGTRSRDIRAPNLFELYAGPLNAFQPGLTDPFTRTSNLIAITRTQGNPNLIPEKAETKTVGFVYSPGWLKGFSGSIDYYDINIKGALSATTAQGTLDGCFAGDQTACARISRDASGNLQQIALVQVNLAARHVRGIDFDGAYQTDLLGGTLGLRAVFNNAISFEDISGGITTQQAGFYNTANQLTIPNWRGNLSATYDIDGWGFVVQERYIGGYNQLPPIPGNVFAKQRIGPVYYTDLTVKYRFDGPYSSDVEVYGTITDLFNRSPKYIANRFAAGLGYPTAPALYDLDERYFTLGVRARF